MKIVISISELRTAFESIPFVEGSLDRDVITISHPRFREDGHKIGITFKKVILAGVDMWVLASTNLIITE